MGAAEESCWVDGPERRGERATPEGEQASPGWKGGEEGVPMAPEQSGLGEEVQVALCVRVFQKDRAAAKWNSAQRLSQMKTETHQGQVVVYDHFPDDMRKRYTDGGGTEAGRRQTPGAVG